MQRPLCIAFVAAALLVGGCSREENTAPSAEPAKVELAKAEAEPPAEAPAKTPKAEPLTQEELDLIDSDPADLTPELRRKRAFALRKRIMQNPDSPAAQALEDMRRKVESGEVVPQLPPKGPEKGLHLEAPSVPAGHPPSSIPDPAHPADPAPAG